MEIAVIGAGSYGSCLAILWSKAGHRVRLCCRSEEAAAQLRDAGENQRYLPGYPLPAKLSVYGSLEEGLPGAEIVVGVTPSHAVRETFASALPWLEDDVVIVNAAKGLEEGSLETIEEVYREVLPAAMAERALYLSGPTFAKEIAAGLPAAIVLAGRDEAAATRVQAVLSCDALRVYRSEDVTGVLVGGALKNVIAIAAGMSDGLGFGLNARAALITRGLKEIARIGMAMGAQAETFAGLSGMGDLVLTCSGDLSRNRRLGLALGRGRNMQEAQDELGMVVEGVKTSKVAYALSTRLQVQTPIISLAYAVLHQGQPAREAVSALMRRPLKHERQ